MKVADIYRLYAAIYMFKILRLNKCPTVQENLTLSLPQHSYNTRQQINFTLPFPRVNAIRYNYEFQFISIWNGLPETLKQASSLRMFKRNFMNMCFESY